MDLDDELTQACEEIKRALYRLGDMLAKYPEPGDNSEFYRARLDLYGAERQLNRILPTAERES